MKQTCLRNHACLGDEDGLRFRPYPIATANLEVLRDDPEVTLWHNLIRRQPWHRVCGITTSRLTEPLPLGNLREGGQSWRW